MFSLKGGDREMGNGLMIEALTDGNCGLRLDGEVDMASAPELEQALAPLLAQGGEVLLDCSALTFMDSAGFRVLIGACDSLAEGGRIVLQAPSHMTARTFDLLGLNRLPHLEIRRGPAESSAVLGFGPGAAHRFELAVLAYGSARANFRVARLRTTRVLSHSRSLRVERTELLASRQS